MSFKHCDVCWPIAKGLWCELPLWLQRYYLKIHRIMLRLLHSILLVVTRPKVKANIPLKVLYKSLEFS